jgi:tetratricopeptide (TPR) repeat protein
VKFTFPWRELALSPEDEAQNREEFDALAEAIRDTYALANDNPTEALAGMDALLARVKAGKTLDKLQRQMLVAYVHDAAGFANLELGKAETGLHLLVKASKIYEMLPDKLPIINNLLNQARAWMLRNDLKEAEIRLERALTLARDGNYGQLEADILYKLGVLYSLTERPDKALELFGKGVLLAQQINNPVTTALFLAQFGQIYLQKGELGKAEDYYDRSRTIFEEADEQDNLMLCYGQLNQLYRRRGDFEKATDFAQLGLKLAQELDNRREQNIFLHDLTLIHMGTEDLSAAAETGHASLQIAREIGDLNHQIRALESLTQIHSNRKDYPKALEYAQEGYRLASEKGSRREAALFLNDFADIKSEQGDVQGALTYYHQLTELFKAEKDWNVLATLYLRMGDVYVRDLHDPAKAAELAEKSFGVTFATHGEAGMFAFTAGLRLIQLIADHEHYEEAFEAANNTLQQATRQLNKYRKNRLKLPGAEGNSEKKLLWLLFTQMLVVVVGVLQDARQNETKLETKVHEVLASIASGFGDTFTMDEWVADLYRKIKERTVQSE